MRTAYVVAFLLAIAATPATADVLYSNGPINGTIAGYPINNLAYAISDSFTVSSAAIVTGVDFGAWVPGTTVTSVDWLIGTAPITRDVASGTAAVTTGPLVNNATDDFFAVPNLALAAGTYYLTLQNAVAAGNVGVGWDINNGPSTAFANQYGGPVFPILDPPNPGTSESFDIQGTTAAVTPEPGYWALLSATIVGLVWVRRRRA